MNWTKYIKLKTKTQNNIVMFDIFPKNDIVILAFFEKKMTEIWVFTNKSAVLVFGFLVFQYFVYSMDRSFKLLNKMCFGFFVNSVFFS